MSRITDMLAQSSSPRRPARPAPAAASFAGEYRETVCVTVAEGAYRLLDKRIYEDIKGNRMPPTKSDLVACALQDLMSRGVDEAAESVDVEAYRAGRKLKRNVSLPRSLSCRLGELAAQRRASGLPFATRTALIELAVVASYA